MRLEIETRQSWRDRVEFILLGAAPEPPQHPELAVMRGATPLDLSGNTLCDEVPLVFD